MVSDWGDYGITAVKYNNNTETKHIDQVRIHKNNGGSVGSAETWTRENVVNALKNYKIITFPNKNSEGRWNIGAEVIKDIVNGTAYIKTKKDNTTRDNLDHLPRF